MVCKNFFRTRPVMEEECLWGKGHRKAVEDILGAVLRGNTAVLLGPRRVGKTSVVSVMAEKLRRKRGYHYVYFNFSRFIGSRAISIADIEPKRTSLKMITTSKSYKISFRGVSVEVRKTSIEEFSRDFSTLVRVLSQNAELGVLIFDEAQVLARLKNLDFRGLLQEITDSYPNISLVFTGSMPGMLVEYLNPGAEKPNFMRSAEIFTLPRWSIEEGRGYLLEGFRSYGIKVTNELELSRAVEELGGVPGFISHYGITAVNLMRTGKSPEEALPVALEESRRYALEEWRKDIEAFLNVYNSRVYIGVLRVLAEAYPSALRGAEIYRRLKILGLAPTRVQHIYKYLETLEKAGFIRSSERKYWIEDPLLREAVKKFNLDRVAPAL
ncbi:AAA family ATPase [Thermococcus nautili]|uniref:Putative ATPase (AAA+ superfamily) n=1 Tax=Thermococcus nautili TaxID=195522 RepID=W8P1G9_9EURY|nr:ATP-binding protein [Thermococcus nautili]AHL22611.1 putative ATPase (AAA+ superfamily) [Thermococcus nautili]